MIIIGVLVAMGGVLTILVVLVRRIRRDLYKDGYGDEVLLSYRQIINAIQQLQEKVGVTGEAKNIMGRLRSIEDRMQVPCLWKHWPYDYHGEKDTRGMTGNIYLDDAIKALATHLGLQFETRAGRDITVLVKKGGK